MSEIDHLIVEYCSGSIDEYGIERLNEWVSRSDEHLRYFRREVSRLSSSGDASAETVRQWRRFAVKNAEMFSPTRVRTDSGFAGYVRMALSVAAMIAVLVVVSSITLYLDRRFNAATESYMVAGERPCEYTTGRGEKRRVILPDSSEVFLNSETRLTIAADFGKKSREIYFDGEGFFNIAHDSERPFIIHGNNGDYRVLGTSFDLQSYSSDNFTVVTLHTGCLQANVRKNVIVLEPMDELQIDAKANSISKRTVDVNNSIEWIQGRLVFAEMPLKDVVNKLSRHYQVSVSVQEDIGNQLYTGVIDEEDLDTALSMIVGASSTRICVTCLGGKYIIHKPQ